MIWWLTHAHRAQAERTVLAELHERVDWLTGVQWRVAEGMRLAVDFDIVHADERFPLTMTYATFYPDTPPLIVPRDGRRLSMHQYGNGGSLCLEYRADNWDTSVTGAMMVESAYRLITGEREDAGPRTVPSAHSETLGQITRTSVLRFIITTSAEVELRKIMPGTIADIGIVEKHYADVWTTTLTNVAGLDVDPAWVQIKGIPGTWFKAGYAVRLPAGVYIPASLPFEKFCDTLALSGFDTTARISVAQGTIVELVVISDDACQFFIAYEHDGAYKSIPYTTILSPDNIANRLTSEHESLGAKRVGIVGNGSIGSKVASILARSGVRQFRLVDDDIFFSPNIVRNDLAQPAVGLHKVDGVKARLEEILGECDVRVRRVAFGGQESADTMESVMTDLSACDVIVDATADAQCFNFCAAVARTHRKPLIWAEVLAGGIGGIVARARPHHDPEPQAVRNRITAWCEAQGVPAPAVPDDGQYEGRSAEGVPLVADDAEVSVIAAHTARFVIDALMRPNASIFPVSAYVIGFRADWLFVAPFDTRPIEINGPSDWQLDHRESTDDERIILLQELFPNEINDNDQPAT